MEREEQSAVRDRRGRWLPGQSGHPAGKPPGTKNRATVARDELRDGEEGAIMRALVEKALGGDLAAARFVLDGSAPKPRGAGIDLGLPPDASVAARMARAIDMMCAGEIAPEDARLILSVLRQDPRAGASAPVSDQYLQETTAARGGTAHPNPPGEGAGSGVTGAPPVSDQYFTGGPARAAAPSAPPPKPDDDGISPEFYLNLAARRAARVARGLPPEEDEARAVARVERLLRGIAAAPG